MLNATNIAKIDAFIDSLILSPYKSFYADLVAKNTEIDTKVVFRYLLSLTHQGKLILKWEVLCPNDGCFNKIKQFDRLEDVLNKNIYCPDCNEEIVATEENIIPVFEFNKDYRNERKKYLLNLKKKTKYKDLEKNKIQAYCV